MQKNGSISIFFTFAIVIILSVVLSITELARLRCQKLYLQLATNNGLESMLSLYHRKLYDFYSLYGVEYRTDEMLNEEYLNYIEPYFIDETIGEYINNWYIANFDKSTTNLVHEDLIIDTNLEKEILEYMKYDIVGKMISFFGKKINIDSQEDCKTIINECTNVFEEIEKSSIYQEVEKRYFDFSKDIKALENYIKKINTNINTFNQNISYCKSMSTSGTLGNGKSVVEKTNTMKSAIDDLEKHIESYMNKLDKFAELVEQKRQQYLDDKATGKYDFSEDIDLFIEEEFKRYKEFVSNDSEVRIELNSKENECKNIKNTIVEFANEVSSYVRALENYELAISEARKEKDSDLVKDLKEGKKEIEKDFSEYLKDVKEYIKDIKLSDCNIQVSKGNYTKEENLLNTLVGMKNGILLNLVLDSDIINSISKNDEYYKEYSILSTNNTIGINKFLLNEYSLNKMNYFLRNELESSVKSKSEAFEVEKLIANKKNDFSNLESIVTKILLFRVGLNVLSIYKSSVKRREARTFAYATFSGFTPLLAETMFLLIITAWGTAQALVDVKRILKGKNVKLIHNDTSWNVDIGSIFAIAGGEGLNTLEYDDDGITLNYKDYLRLFLLSERQDNINSRMVSIIDKNICKEQESFDFSKLAYSFEAKNDFICKHFFTNMIFVNAKDVTLFDEYSVKTNGYRSYFE